MESTTIFLWAVVTFVGYRLWIWLKTNRSQQILDHFRYQIRSGLKAVGIKELETVQENFSCLEQQVRARLSHVKIAENFSHQIQKCPQEINPPLVHFEQSGDSIYPKDAPSPRSRSIEWNGLRFTLSDSFWAHMGVTRREDLEDGQLQTMVQGPFCRVCLKRLVGRDRTHTAEVPAHCPHCGLSWGNQQYDSLSISLVDLKGQVYDHLINREFKMSGNGQ
ncbi:MAG: hypothetical protein P8X46_02860 [Nitrospirales bacterium]